MDPKLYAELQPLLDMPTPPDGQGRIWSYCVGHPDGTKSGKSPGGGRGNLKGRSLSLHPSFGLQCFAGCTDGKGFERVLGILRERGPRQGPSNSGSKHSNSMTSKKKPDIWRGPDGSEVFGIPSHARLMTEYQYKRPDGHLVAVKGRWEWLNEDGGTSKSFKWHLPGQPWSKGLTDTRCARGDDGEMNHVKACKCIAASALPLWGAEKIAAMPPEIPVWFVEGEKACQALTGRNEIATCLGGGAGQVKFDEGVFEPLRGHAVRLWPDNDEAGMSYMVTVRKALTGIAKSVIMVQPAVKPKGDAFDYFLGSPETNNIAAVLDGVVVPGEIAVDVISDDHFRIRIPHDEGIGLVVFEFDQLAQSRAALEGELTVTVMAPNADADPYSLRINLLSASAREGLARSLAAQFGKNENWTKAISTAWAKVREAFVEIERGMLVEELPEPSDDVFLVDEIVEDGAATVLFGDGSAGKSYVSIGLATAVALGANEFAGKRVFGQRNVLYVDWENGGDRGRQFKRRCRRVWRGLDLPPEIWGDIPLRYWDSGGSSLSGQLEPIRRYIQRHNIGLVIIDSAMPACGGAPEDADVVLSFFAALAKLRCTTFILSHVSKDSTKEGRIPDRAYGNQVWHNMPRRTFYQRRTSPEDSNSIELALFCRKVNNGAFPGPVGLRLCFGGGPDSAAWFEHWDISESAEMEAIGVSPWRRAMNVIQQMPMAMATTEDVAEGLGMSVAEAYVILNDRRAKTANNNKGLFRAMGGKERDKGQKWALNAQDRGDEPPPPPEEYEEAS